MIPKDDAQAHQPQLFVIKLTAADDPGKVIGYAMAEQIDFVADRDDLLGATKEALEAARESFRREKVTLDAVAIPPHKSSGAKIFAMIGSGRNDAA